MVGQVRIAASLQSGWRSRFPAGAASEAIRGASRIVSKPGHLIASPWAGQFRVLQAGGVGLPLRSSHIWTKKDKLVSRSIGAESRGGE